MLATAIEIARANPIIGLPRMGAVIARRKKIVSVGLNSLKSDPLQMRYARHPAAICMHAEIAAIKNAIKSGKDAELAGSSIYVARVLRDGVSAMAEPCEGCKRALKEYGISRSFWTINLSKDVRNYN